MTETSRDAKRARTAQRILDAARQEFATRGFDGATIRGIAGAAGVDASLVMQHYGSKAALFTAETAPDGRGEVNLVRPGGDHTALAPVAAWPAGQVAPGGLAVVGGRLYVPCATGTGLYRMWPAGTGAQLLLGDRYGPLGPVTPGAAASAASDFTKLSWVNGFSRRTTLTRSSGRLCRS